MDLKDFLSQKQLQQLKESIKEKKESFGGQSPLASPTPSGSGRGHSCPSASLREINKVKDDYFKKPKTDAEKNKEKYKTIIDYLYSV